MRMPGEGKERRQQQDRHQVLEARRQRAGEPAVVRDDGAEQERAEDRVHADRFGDERRHEQGHERQRDGAPRRIAIPGRAHEPRRERPDDREHRRR